MPLGAVIGWSIAWLLHVGSMITGIKMEPSRFVLLTRNRVRPMSCLLGD